MKTKSKFAAALLAGALFMVIPSFVSAATLQQKNEALQLVEKGNKAKKLVDQEMFYNQAIQLDPNCVEAYFQRGRMYYMVSVRQDAWTRNGQSITLPITLAPNYQQALADYDKVLSMNPKYPKMHVYKAEVFAQLNQNELVTKEYDAAIECDPKDKMLYIDAANWCKKIGNNEHALELYSQALNNKVGQEKLDGVSQKISDSFDDGYYLYFRGKLYYDMGRKEEAMSDFGEILKIENSPSQRWAHQFRARIYSEAGNYQQAVDEYTKMLEIWHYDGWAYLLRGYAYFYLGEKEKALDDFREAIKIKTPDALYGEYVQPYKYTAKCYDAMAFYFLEDKQYTRALENIGKAIYNDPGNTEYKIKQDEILKAYRGFDKPKEL